MQTPAPTPTDELIREAAREVFAAPAYNRFSVWERFWGAVWEFVSRMFRRLIGVLEPLVPRTPIARWMLGILIVVLILVAAWLAITWWRQREARLLVSRTSGGEEARASFRSAEELASRGLFTEAAHALYRSLLATASERGLIRIHHSKTIGDYVRELRRQAPTLFARFREFARTYEYVIYGIGECDRDRYERLRALAQPVVHGAVATGGTHE